MKIPRIYIDTSIVGGCLDKEFASESRALLDMAREGKIILLVSDLLLEEIEGAPSDVKAVLSSLTAGSIERITDSNESDELALKYLAEEILTPKSDADARHVALATVSGAEMIVSWNFKHIVHYDKIQRFNGVNLLMGFRAIRIHSPMEVVTREDREDL